MSYYAQKVVAIDLSQETIVYARQKYVRNNLDFFTMNSCRLGFDNGTFDVICSFEMIEHVLDAGDYLKEAQRVLNQEGIFIVSTPNKNNYLLHGKNEFHVKEYSLDEFRSALQKYFSKVEFFGQICGSRFRKYYNYALAGIFLKFKILTYMQNFLSSFAKPKVITLDEVKPVIFSFQSMKCGKLIFLSQNARRKPAKNELPSLVFKFKRCLSNLSFKLRFSCFSFFFP
ncbi:MAG: class I SAM-dependent methyltransferase [Candidatus Omnitrophica bacterium]|nr:class I SAM-dependent methyltransferase [Candidatus Omnitrophota bacterium]